MNKRELGKVAAKIIVGTSVGNFVTKALLANAPKTEKLKTAEITGLIAGAVAADKFEPYSDRIVDDLFDRYDRFAKRNQK